jgi:hypothetical protein
MRNILIDEIADAVEIMHDYDLREIPIFQDIAATLLRMETPAIRLQTLMKYITVAHSPLLRAMSLEILSSSKVVAVSRPGNNHSDNTIGSFETSNTMSIT